MALERGVHPEGVAAWSGGAPSFVGRERELAELRSGLADAQCGRGRLFLIVGEPGIGKTRLATELTAYATAAGAHVLWGRCWEDGGPPAYWPWVQMFRSLLRGRDPHALAAALGAGAACLAPLIPELREPATLAGVPPAASSLDPEHGRFELFDAATTFLVRQAALGPLVLVFDDLHAADPPSLLLLQFLARELRDARLLIIGTYRVADIERDPERARIVSGIARHGHRVPLSGWSEEEVGRFIGQAFAPDAPDAPSAALVAAVHRSTDGNPFFVDEVVRVLASESRAHPASDLTLNVRIPHGIRDVIRERLEPLSPQCRRLLASAAVIGREFDVSCLREVADVETEGVLELLGEVVAAGIVSKVPGTVTRYGFAHALIRETLYEDVPAAPRLRLHWRIAQVLERLYAHRQEPSCLAELAHHFFEALPSGEVDKAIAYAARAGEQAAAQLAYEDAAAHYQRALQALDLVSEESAERRCALLLAVGDLQARTASGTARDTFQRAATLARTLPAAEPLAHAALGFANLGLGVPHGTPDQQVVALLEEALARLPEDDSVLRARLLARLAAEISVSDDRQRGAAYSEDAVAMARRVGDPRTLANTLNARHFVLWRSDYIASRLSIASEVVLLADGIGSRELAMQGRTWRLLDLMGAGDFRTFDAELQAYARLADILRQPRYLWLTVNFRAVRALWSGHFEEAEAFALQALALGERTDDESARISPWIQIFAIRREQGRLAEQEPATRMAVERYPGSPVPRTLLALLCIEQGRTAEATSEFERVALENFEDLRRERRIGVLPYLSEVCAALADAARAALLYDLLQPYTGSNLPYAASLCLGAAPHYMGLLAATLARWDEAADHFEDALKRHEAMSGRPWVARTQYEYARLLLGAGGPLRRHPDPAARRQAALGLLEHARAAAADLGMSSLGEHVQQLLAATLSDEPDRAVAYGGSTPSGGEPTGTRSAVTDLPRAGRLLHLAAKREQQPGVAGRRNPNSAERSERAESSRGPEHGVFRLDGEYWSVGDGTRVLRLKDSKGLRYLAHLLRRPGVELHVTDLVTPEHAGVEPIAGFDRISREQLEGLGMHAAGSHEGSEPVLDAHAKAAYKRRLVDLRDQLDEATRFNDVARAATARAEIELLTQELARAVGLHGRDRGSSSHAERTRLNVTRAIKAAVKRIAERHPELGLYLTTTVKTGAFCSYTPDPRIRMQWTF